MKRIFVIMLIMSLFISCGTSAVVKEAKRTIAGDWELTNIRFPEERVRVSLLNEIPSECLEGSNWNFIANNNTGSYVPSRMGCAQDPNFFIWAVSETDEATEDYDLMLKPTDANFKSTTGNQGYRIDLVNLTTDEMVWEQTVNFEGEPFTIRMNFKKR